MESFNSRYGSHYLSGDTDKHSYSSYYLVEKIILPAISQGNCAENTASKLELSREEQDEFAIGSYKKTAAAWEVIILFLFEGITLKKSYLSTSIRSRLTPCVLHLTEQLWKTQMNIKFEEKSRLSSAISVKFDLT